MFRILFLFVFISTSLFGQNDKVFFDRLGNQTSESNAYYYRVSLGNEEYKSYYNSTQTIYFEGKILNANSTSERDNMFNGTCVWYYKNGNKQAVRTFNGSGIEEGTSTFYYESGNISKKITYKNGRIENNRYIEYDENGSSARIFEEKFDNNYNDWALYTSELGSAKIVDGKFILTSLSKKGASRHISVYSESKNYALESNLDLAELPNDAKTGLIYGYKDWDNYNFFLISNSSFYVGQVFEGITSMLVEGMYANNINSKGKNNIKIISLGGKDVFTINGEVQYKTDKLRMKGSNIGIAVSGKNTIIADDIIFKELNYSSAGGNNSSVDANVDIKASGSGVFVSTSGYIITNYHVIDKANEIYIEAILNGIKTNYKAVVVHQDKASDLAILKIEDPKFTPLKDLKYSFKESGAVDVGTSVFTIGFPLALSGMGTEAKYVDGKVSSKTGYNNSISTFQTSVPVQPGNSGGPLFNTKGELVGIINAKVEGADNVSYAIKINYVKAIMDLLSDEAPYPNDQSLLMLNTQEQFKILTEYVVMIKCK